MRSPRPTARSTSSTSTSRAFAYQESAHDDAGRRDRRRRRGTAADRACRSATTCASPRSSASRPRRGANVVTLPSAFTAPTGKDHWEPLLRARAIENQVFVIAPDQHGASTPKLHWHGRSMIVDPWGVVLAQAPDTECFITADLDLDAQARRPRPHPERREPPARDLRLTGGHGDRPSHDLVRVPARARHRRARAARRGARLRAGVALRLARAVRRRLGAPRAGRRGAPSASDSAPRCWSPGCATRSRRRARSRRVEPGSRRAGSWSRSAPGSPARMALGQKALPWADTRTYIAQVKGLLEGEAMVVDGQGREDDPARRLPARASDPGADRRGRERPEGIRGRARARRRRDDHLRRPARSSTGRRCSRSAPCSTPASPRLRARATRRPARR